MRFRLTTTYEEKEEAKRYGARWDGEGRYWYFEGDSLPEELMRWYDPTQQTTGDEPERTPDAATQAAHNPSMSFDKRVKDYHHICWYPSAGEDFHGMLYLSETFYSDYSKEFKYCDPYPEEAYRILPDLFIFTDHDEKKEDLLKGGKFESPILHTDRRTDILVAGERKKFMTEAGYGYLMPITVSSKFFCRTKPLKWNTMLMYIIADNDEFYEKCLENNGVTVETIIEIRSMEFKCFEYLKKRNRMLKRLGTSYFIAEDDYCHGLINYHREMLEQGENLEGIVNLDEFYRLRMNTWSDRDGVMWCKVQ